MSLVDDDTRDEMYGQPVGEKVNDQDPGRHKQHPALHVHTLSGEMKQCSLYMDAVDYQRFETIGDLGWG